jgi:hypothetical protein
MKIQTRIAHEVEIVSPLMAENWLSNLHDGQRPVARRHVERLAADMTEGRFALSPDAICITENGRLANGQHRLRAVVKSGVSVPMVIARGWPEDVYSIMDAGLRRALHYRVNADWMRSKPALAMVKQAMLGLSDRRGSITEQEVVAYGEKHEAVFSAIIAMPKAANVRSSVLAACARAMMNGAPPSRIQRFIDVVYTGVGDGAEESGAIRLFSFLQSSAQYGGNTMSLVYAKSLSALRAFLSGTPIAKIYALDSDAFWPLPEGQETYR